jgi:hypothetical protein
MAVTQRFQGAVSFDGGGPGAGAAPAPVQGTIAATTTGVINPSGLTSCIVTMGSTNTTLSVSPGYAGQSLRLEIKQGATPHLVTLDPGTFSFSADTPSYVVTASANAIDRIQIIMGGDGTHWAVAAVAKGFTV